MAARPATRRRANRTLDEPHRPAVRDLGRGSSSFTIEWDVRPAFDFVFSLSGEAGSTDDLPTDDRHWLTEAKASLPDETRTGLTELFDSELCINAGVLLIDRPEIRTSAEFVELIASTEPRDVIRPVLEDHHHDPEINRLVERALDGDSAVFDALEKALPDWNRQGRMGILRDPLAARDRIVEVLEAWQKRFAEVEPRVAEILGGELGWSKRVRQAEVAHHQVDPVPVLGRCEAGSHAAGQGDAMTLGAQQVRHGFRGVHVVLDQQDVERGRLAALLAPCRAQFSGWSCRATASPELV